MAVTRATFSVAGMTELKTQLDRLSRAVGRRALERAGVEAAEPTARLMRQLAPKDTGELAESIDVGVSASNDDAGLRGYADVLRSGGSAAEAVTALRDIRRAERGARGDTFATVFIGPVAGRSRDDVIKGYVQEFGTATRTPNSFVRAAFEQDRDDLLRRLSENVQFEVFAAIGRAQARGRLA